MTHEQKINFIKEKCIEANPSILDLVFGSTIEYKPLKELRIPDRYGKYVVEGRGKDSVNIWFDGSETGSQKPYTVFLKGKDIEIIGRPIRLADVLLAIKQKFFILSSFNQEIEAHRKLLLPSYLNGVWQSDNLWDLKNDNLESQSPETIDFLFTLLGGNA